MSEVLVVVGGGRMGTALIGGLLAAGRPLGDLAVVDPDERRRDELARRHPGLEVQAELPDPCPTALLAVKPAVVRDVCRVLGAGSTRRILSIAAGVSIARIREWLADDTVVVVRGMPNTPALVGAGAAALALGPGASSEDEAWAAALLGAVGTVLTVPEESLDAVTGLSGSGPAYVFLLAEALIEGGVLAGLPRETARSLVVQTVLGAGRMLAETGEAPEALRAAVTSPGGTTAAALAALERGGVRAAVLDAVLAARDRSVGLGGD